MATKNTQNQAKVRSGHNLVIVESPTKARTISRYLGKDYVVLASGGHVRDLPTGKLGVDIGKSFEPEYVPIKGKQTTIAELRKAAKGAQSIYLATDPDREGEAISWHLKEAAGWTDLSIRRVSFFEITPEAIQAAFQNYREIDMQLVNAQQARRILDRLVGYQISPLLWRKVQKGLSAGRVQSVALRLVVDRETEIRAFIPIEYWSIEATLETPSNSTLSASFHGPAGVKKAMELPDQSVVGEIEAELNGAKYSVTNINSREIKRKPAAPFITSTLQQEAWRKLRLPARRTMAIAQELYEGIALGQEGSTGLITYMRTDSPQVGTKVIDQTRGYITKHYGNDFIPSSPRKYQTRSKVAQEAHEAIRPTDVSRSPESIQQFLGKDQYRLYELIWQRMVGSQMSDAILTATQVEITASNSGKNEYIFRSTGSIIKFLGFRLLYQSSKDDDPDDPDDASEGILPAVQEGDLLKCLNLEPQQHFTAPPPAFTEASLIKSLEELGIGRPSTYAPIISTLTDRQYVTRDKGAFHPTRLGEVVNEQLVNHFPSIMDFDFTAHLEKQLDDIANGKQEWIPTLQEFYDPFNEALGKATIEMPRIRVEEPTNDICEKCGSPMVIKSGRFGPFMTCSGFPNCRNSRPIIQKTGANCPKCKDGELLQRRGRGRIFFGCSKYPGCDFTVSSRPIPTSCPECEGLLVAGSSNSVRCTNCAFRGPRSEVEVDDESSYEHIGTVD